MTWLSGQRAVWLALAVLAALAFACYYPTLSGPLMHDDFPHIGDGTPAHWKSLDDPNIAITYERMPTRWVTMTTFGLQYLLFGDSTVVGKAINLGLHILNSGLLFLLTFWLFRWLPDTSDTRRGWLALAVTALWALHPLQVSTVAYTIQRLTLLSATFSLAAMALWAYWLAGDRPRRRLWQPMLALVLVFLAYRSKENGALVPLFLLLTAVIAGWRPRPPFGAAARVLATVALLGVTALLAWRLPGYWDSRILPAYSLREFDVAERLLTESRVVMFYLSEILWPAHGRMSLHLDDITISRSLLTPPTTLASLAVITLLLCVGTVLTWRRSLVGFGILLFFVGHVMESSVIGLEIAYEHRNYLPLAGIAIAFVTLVARLPRPAWQAATLACATLVCLANLAPRAAAWSSELTLNATAVQNRPDSPRANYFYGMQLLRLAERAESRDATLAAIGREHLLNAARLEPSDFVALQGVLHVTPPGEEYDALWRDMEARARYGVISRGMFNTLQFMARCAVERPDCPLPTANIERVFRAARENPRMATDRRRRNVERLFGSLLVRATGKVEEGLQVSRAAASPGCSLCRVSYFRNLVFAGRLEEARAYYPSVSAGHPLSAEEAASLGRALDQLQAKEQAALP